MRDHTLVIHYFQYDRDPRVDSTYDVSNAQALLFVDVRLHASISVSVYCIKKQEFHRVSYCCCRSASMRVAMREASSILDGKTRRTMG
jgi:hypothetical protein